MQDTLGIDNLKVEALKPNVNRIVFGNKSVTSLHSESLALKRRKKRKKEMYTVIELTPVSCELVSRGEGQFSLIAGALKGQLVV